jgi:hypothetical protein
LKNILIDINGNVYGKVAVAKHFNLIMVNYIGFKEKTVEALQETRLKKVKKDDVLAQNDDT